MPISQLVYTSQTRNIGPSDVQTILDQAREGNLRAGVTGVLIFNQNYFCQCLEGGREEVTKAFCRIASDPRHNHVSLVAVHDVDARDFPDWSMGYVSNRSADVDEPLRDFLPNKEFNSQILAASSAIAVMKGLRDLRRTAV